MSYKENYSAKKPEEKNKTSSVSRRTFLIAASSIAGMLALGGAAATRKDKTFLRPPGGQNEKALLSKCIKCDRCRSVCPTSVIGVVQGGESFLAARTPVMKFHRGYCNFCGRCVDVCPTQALESFDIAKVNIGLAQVTDRCIAWNSGGCAVCIQECPYHAIVSDDQKRPVVDHSKCNGCGICEKVCPALVLRSYIGGTVRGIEVRPLSQRVP
jgi:ferredoxin-type protein NapG